MDNHKVIKTYKEINDKIKSGDVVVVSAEEMIDIVSNEGAIEAAKKVDVVTTGTFAPMCSSGAFINFGHSVPGIKASKTEINNVPAYAGVAAVDCYIGATEPEKDDPLNKVYPGDFNYGGGHVIQDLVAGKEVSIYAEGYGTTCYPNKKMDKKVTLKDIPQATLCNPRNAYQNYNCAINKTGKTIYTYMGTLKPHMANANYCSAGALSPLFNDPFYKTIGIGTRVFLGGGEGYVAWHGTQHNPEKERTEDGNPISPSGTLWLMGDLKGMKSEWLVGLSLRGYGCSLMVGVGVPIPILNEEIAQYTGVSNKDLFTHVVDYGYDYPNGISKNYGKVSYEELMSGSIHVEGVDIPTVPLSSIVKAREIASQLKEWIVEKKFSIGEPQFTLPGSEN